MTGRDERPSGALLFIVAALVVAVVLFLIGCVWAVTL